jgi:hypothetical protein
MEGSGFELTLAIRAKQRGSAAVPTRLLPLAVLLPVCNGTETPGAQPSRQEIAVAHGEGGTQ